LRSPFGKIEAGLSGETPESTGRPRRRSLRSPGSGFGRSASSRANAIAVTNSVLICLLAARRAAAIFAGYRGFPDDEGVQLAASLPR
jgi:hypothetical protein